MIDVLWQKIWHAAGAPHRAAERLKKEKEAILAAINSLPPVEELICNYHPQISQTDLMAVRGADRSPWPTEAVLSAELSRIDEYLVHLMDSHGIPIRANSIFIQPYINLFVEKMTKLLQQKYFCEVELPLFFTMQRGWLQFEDTRREQIGQGYRGLQSGFHYDVRPDFQQRLLGA